MSLHPGHRAEHSSAREQFTGENRGVQETHRHHLLDTSAGRVLHAWPPKGAPCCNYPLPLQFHTSTLYTEARGGPRWSKSDVTWLKTLLTVLRIKPKSLVHLQGLHIGQSPQPYLITAVPLCPATWLSVIFLNSPLAPEPLILPGPLSWHPHLHPVFRGVVAPPEVSPTSGQANPLPPPRPMTYSHSERVAQWHLTLDCVIL